MEETTMPKKGMRGIRRQQFINAAIKVILQDGLTGISNKSFRDKPNSFPTFIKSGTVIVLRPLSNKFK